MMRFVIHNYYITFLHLINYGIETFQFCENSFFDRKNSSADAFPLKNNNFMMEIKCWYCGIGSGWMILILSR